MDNYNIINTIKEKGLVYLPFDQMVSKLIELTGLTNEEIKDKIKDLILNGDLMYDSNQRLFITSQRGYIKCKICGNKKGFAFAEIVDNPEKKPDIFIAKDLLKGALDDDIVLVNIINQQGDNIDGEVITILKHITEYVVGEFKVVSRKYYVYPDDDKLPTLRINADDRMGAVEGDKVVAKIVFESQEIKMRGIITECLGKAGTVAAEEMSIIRSYKLRDKFSDAVLQDANHVLDEIQEKDKKNRIDLTEARTITIDGEDSRDFDDAISVEKTESGYSVGVHIADVSHYVTEGSALDAEAYLRGNSVYFPDLVIPMLPEKLSNGICSLREGVERLTLSVLIELDNDAKVVKSKVANTVIKSHHRMTYTKIQKMLDGDNDTINEYKDIYNDVLLYSEISNKLKNLRYARGEIRLDIPEPKVFENDSGEIDRIEKQVQDESHQLIESLMILANEVVAETYFSKKLPFIYRVHEKPETSKVTKLIDVCAGLGIGARFDAENPTPYDYQKLVTQIEDDPRKFTLMKVILRSMMKACYNDNCLGHFGIASTFYCHFTSPIRRYPDLMIHRIIKRFLDGTNSKELHIAFDEIVATASEQSSLTEKRADEVERAVDDYKKALYMQKHLGEKYTALISGVHEFGIFVELDNTIEGLIKFEYLPVDNYEYDDRMQMLKGLKHTYKLGDSIEVICVNANTKLRQIDFDLAERLNSASIEEILALRNNSFAKKQSHTSTLGANRQDNGTKKKCNSKFSNNNTGKKQTNKSNINQNRNFGHKRKNKDAYSRKNNEIYF